MDVVIIGDRPVCRSNHDCFLCLKLVFFVPQMIYAWMMMRTVEEKALLAHSGSVDFFYELTQTEMEKLERVVSSEAVIAPGTDLPRFDVILLCEKPCLHNIVFWSELGERVTGQKGKRYASFFLSKIHHHRWRAGRIVDIIEVTVKNV